MTAYAKMSHEELTAKYEALQEAFAAHKAKGLALNMARGKPSPEQLDAVSELLDTVGAGSNFITEDGADARNYGNLQGLIEARRMMSTIINSPAENIIITGESSLTAEYDLLAKYLLFGTDGNSPRNTHSKLKWK